MQIGRSSWLIFLSCLLATTGSAKVWAAGEQNRPNNGALTAGAIVVSARYPSWFMSKSDNTAQELTFRKFSYEGIARNIVVLTCPKDPLKPAKFEMIPPKAIEHILKQRGSETFRETSMALDEGERKTGDALVVPTTYDKIAAFVDADSDDKTRSFITFLDKPSVRVTLLEPNIQYLLIDNEPYKKLFRDSFPMFFDKTQFEETSSDQVLARCKRGKST
jgi:hypothetical protein